MRSPNSSSTSLTPSRGQTDASDYVSKKLKTNETTIADPTAARYRLSEQAAQQRVQDFASNPAPAALENEIALARYLIERSVNRGDDRAAGILLTCLNKLSRSHIKAGLLSHQLLTKATVIRLAEEMLSIIHAEFSSLPGFEDAFDKAATRISRTIEAAENSVTDLPADD